MSQQIEVNKYVLKNKLMLLDFRPDIVAICHDVDIVPDHILIPPFAQSDFVIKLIKHCHRRSPLDVKLYNICLAKETLPPWSKIDVASEQLGGVTKYIFDFLAWLIPKPSDSRAEYEKIKLSYPELSGDELAKKIIQRTAWATGGLGALSGVGGALLLIITVPFDLVYSMHLQAKMTQMIGFVYGYSEQVIDMRTVVLITLAGEAAISDILRGAEKVIIRRTGRRASRKIGTRFLSKSVVQFVPILGALLGFILNFWIAMSSGKLLMKFYKGELSLDDIHHATESAKSIAIYTTIGLGVTAFTIACSLGLVFIALIYGLIFGFSALF